MRKLAGALLVAGALHSSLAGAVGLGKLSLDSALGEPFSAELNLMGVGGLDASQIRVKLATQDDFDRIGVDRLYFLSDLNFKVETNSDGTGTISVTSRRNVLEPFLDFVVAVEWPQGRILREYTVLLDLPTIEKSVSHSMAAPAVTTRNTSADKGAMVNRSTSSTSSNRAVQRDRAVAAAQEGGSYRIQSGDTLWNIAKAARPNSGLSINQTMLAIQELNPEAFINNNINLLKAGKVLRLPTEEQITDIGKQQANQKVASQMDDWRKGVSSPEIVPTIDAAQTRPEQQKAKEETAAGQLTLSTTDDEASNKAAGIAEETLDKADDTEADTEGTVETVVTASDEDSIEDVTGEQSEQEIGVEESVDDGKLSSDAEAELAASKAREAEELKERLARAESIAETTQEIASLKDAQINTLQENLKKKQLEDSEEGSKTSFLLMLAGGILALIIVGLFFLMRRGSQEKKNVELFELETPAVAKPAPAPEPKPAPAPEPKPAPAPVVNAESAPTEVIDAVEEEEVFTEDFEEDDADATVMMAAVDLPEDETADTETIEALVDEPLEEIEDVEEAPTVAEEPAETQVEMPVVSAEAQTGDVVSEADIYMSLGRHAQAVAMLEKAISDDGKNMKLRIKLLEVHVDNGDKDAFLKDYKALQQTGDHQAIGKAKELLLSVDDADAWLGEEKPAVTAKPAPAAKADEATQVTDAITQADLSAIPDESVVVAPKAAEPEPEDDERIEVSLNDSELDFLADNDEIATKLDLARAYIDMGDIDGARDILDEVLKEGDESAKNEAQKLLSGIQ